ncbi:hypothetical protein V2J09_003334 [Rumex salicifolius]
MAEMLQKELKELGWQLESHLPDKGSLLEQLKHAANLLSNLEQCLATAILESMQPFLKALINPELLDHQDKDLVIVRSLGLLHLKRLTVIFGLIISTLSGLNDSSGISFGRRGIILEILARYRSCIVLLDLECDDLVAEIFRTFIAIVRDDHPNAIVTSMKMIMVMLVEESDEVHQDNLLTLLSSLGWNKKEITEAARNLSMSVIKHCTSKLEPAVKQLLISSMSGDSWSSKCQIDYHEVIVDLYQCSPEILSGVVPYLTGELLADQSESRIRAVRLVGEIFAIPGREICEAFKPIFTEFLKRLTDRIVEVRMTVLDCIKNCLLSYPSRPEAPQIFAALHDRLLDYDENVRKQVVAVVFDLACHALDSVPVETVKLVSERLRDKSLLVKKCTFERLAEIYRLDCMRGTKGCAQEYDWIPGKILRCFYDKDFRYDTVEIVLCESMFPADFTIKHRVRQWIRILPGLDKVEVKGLEKILEQKQRLQQEMQKYLTFKQTYKDSGVPNSQVKGMSFFRVLSRCFTDPEKAEESFQLLDQLKDANIWNILSNILDPDTSFAQAHHSRDDILKILGEKHQLLDFMSTLSVKCSYILFNKEHVKEILSEVVAQKSAGSSQDVVSCMDMLVMLARYSAFLFAGSEDELLNLLKEDDEILKDGVLNVLAMAGGTIRERLASSSILVDLILERLCFGGSRRQAKYAVRALSAIKKDDGLLSLYKKLVDMLKEKSNLPSVLQSLGCIAQTAPAVFETRESEVVEFIKTNILETSNKIKDQKKELWHDGSENCQLKIFGIKTLVKSYLPVKDAHLRVEIDNIIEILRSILSYGEISKEIKSSSVDRAHLRLASAKAVLRLSRHWDHKIPADVFHLTVRTIEGKQINFPQARKVFRGKIHQYVKDRVLDAKYACALLFSIYGPKQEFEECKNDLTEIIQMCRQVRARQLSLQSDASFPMPYPEFILPYLIHSLAHHPLFPCIEESKNVKPFEPIYRILYSFLSMIVHGDEVIQPEAKIDEKAKECTSVLTSILMHVKRSVDVLDAAKSKNSYAICDLGLLIIKCLAKQQDLHHDEIAPLTLPSNMYKPGEKEDDCGVEAGDTTTWLAEDSIAAHFESPNFDANGPVPLEIDADEIVGDDEIDGNEMPLGKLIRRIKSKKVKATKEENDSSTVKEKTEDQDADVLKVVQEKKLDGLGISINFETNNGCSYPSGVETKNHDEKETKKRKDSDDTLSAVVPKRQRSTAKSSSKRSAPKSMNSLSCTSKKDKLFKEEDAEPNDSDLLVSCAGKKSKSTISSQGSDEEDGRNEEIGASDEKKLDLETHTKGGNADKSSSETGNKRKRRSIAGLSKSSPVGSGLPTTDLVDCRVKIWWPLDKKFYEGIVKSYDPEKKKHVVLYEDGDVEVLRLDKECWELIPDSGKLSKKSKPSQSPRKQGLKSKRTKVLEDSGSKNDERDTPLKYYRTQKKNVKPNPKTKTESVSKGKSALPPQKAENISDTSAPESSLASQIDALHTGDPEVEKQASDVDSPPPKEEEISKSETEELEGDGKKDDNSKGVDEEMKPAIEGDQDEEMEGTRDSSQSSDLKKSNSEEKQAEKPSKRSQKKTKNVKQLDEAYKRTAEGNRSQSPDPECAEDEPIKPHFAKGYSNVCPTGPR